MDLLGNVMFRGPGDSVGMLSLFVGEHMTTVVTHTYVHANYIDSNLFVDSLQKCPREKSRFEYTFLIMEDRFVIIRDVLTDEQNLVKHEEETSLENLQKNFAFSNYPPKIRLAERCKVRYTIIFTILKTTNFKSTFLTGCVLWSVGFVGRWSVGW